MVASLTMWELVSQPRNLDGYTLGMQKIVVAGPSGAGKSTIARKIAERLDIPYAELDAMYHGPDWTKIPEFE